MGGSGAGRADGEHGERAVVERDGAGDGMDAVVSVDSDGSGSGGGYEGRERDGGRDVAYGVLGRPLFLGGGGSVGGRGLQWGSGEFHRDGDVQVRVRAAAGDPVERG